MNSLQLQHFESQLAQFELACNHGRTLPELLTQLQEAVSTIANVSEIRAAIVEAGQFTSIGDPLSESDISNLTAVGETARLQQPAGRPILTDRQMLFVRELSREHRLLMQFNMDDDPRQNSLLPDAAGATTDCFAAAATRELASALVERLRERERAGPLVRALFRSNSLRDCARTLADHGASITGKGRVSVMTRIADQFRLIAVTGVSDPDSTADAVKRIQEFAGLVVRAGADRRWIETRNAGSVREFSEPLSWYASNQVRAIRVEPVRARNDSRSGDPRVCVMIEVFEDQALPTDGLVEFLMIQAADAIESCPHAEPEAERGRAVLTARRIAPLILMAFILLLIFLPADFELEVSGQIFPVRRHRIFAPDDGIVEVIDVHADDRVSMGQFLLRLQNAELGLERSRLLGEIDSTSSRLQAIRATRSSSGSIPTAKSQWSMDLSSEELQLNQKLAALREEQSLVDQQIAGLSLNSPMAGVVYQHRLKDRLEGRPVQRGQELLEIVNTVGDWQLELQIPEEIVGYVRYSVDSDAQVQTESDDSASSRKDTGQLVRFWLPGRSSQCFKSAIDSLELSTHVEGQRLTCLATVPCRDIDTGNLRPGQSVTARIYCGRRSLGFVWFREVIEYWQRRSFAWL